MVRGEAASCRCDGYLKPLFQLSRVLSSPSSNDVKNGHEGYNSSTNLVILTSTHLPPGLLTLSCYPRFLNKHSLATRSSSNTPFFHPQHATVANLLLLFQHLSSSAFT
jgi:hypothetical protein